jgi:type II secretory pathway component PulC
VHVTVGRDVIDVVRRQGLTHFRAVADGSGGIRGIAVYDVDPGSCLEVLGFQEDDVIVNVNGFDFATPDAYREMYESIDTENGATVRFERGTNTLELRFDISRTP